MIEKDEKKDTYADLLHRFEALETYWYLGALTLQGVPIWDVLRYPVFEGILAQYGIRRSSQSIGESRGRIRTFGRAVNLILRAFSLAGRKSWLRAPARQIFIFGHPRRKWNGSCYEDIYVDPLIDKLQLDVPVAVVERPSKVGHLKPTSTENLFNSDATAALASLLSHLPGLGLSKADIKKLQEIQDGFEKEFGNQAISVKQVDRTVRTWRCRYAICRRILKVKMPPLVCVVVSTAHCSLIMAAKSLNIPTLELQHGSPVRGKLNYDYTSGVQKRSFPDSFAAFGGFWSSRVQLPIPKDRIFSIGFAYFSRQVGAYVDVEKSNRLIILSQATVARELVDFACKLGSVLGDRCEVVFKPHPQENQNDVERYKRHLESNGVIVAKREDDLYWLLATAKWQLGVYSTALFEGIGLGAACFILKAGGHHYMSDLVENKLARQVETPEDIDLSYSVADSDINWLFRSVNGSAIKKLLKSTCLTQLEKSQSFEKGSSGRSS